MKNLNFLILNVLLTLSISSGQVNSIKFIDLTKQGLDPRVGYELIKDYLNPCSNLETGFLFDYGYHCKRYGQVSVMLSERVRCSSSTLELTALFDPMNPVDCFNRGFSTPYSGGMIHQDLGSSSSPSPDLWTYGYFETEVIIPNSRGIFPSFWLYGHGGGNAGINEIDIFEYGVGDVTVFTSHYRENNENKFFQKWLYSLPNQSFSNIPVRYGLKWEPNRIIWYVNDNPVRIHKSNAGKYPIQNSPMGVIANNQFEKGKVKYTDNLPSPDSATMIINYIQVYQKIPDAGTDIDFNINGEKANTIGTAIEIPSQIPSRNNIIVNNLNSYLPDNTCYIILTWYEDCKIENSTILFEGWVSPEYAVQYCEPSTLENANIDIANISSFIPKGFWNELDINECYSLTIATRDTACPKACPYRCNENEFGESETNFFKLLPCNPEVEFTVNGSPTTCQDTGKYIFCADPININENNGKSKIILDLEGTISCNYEYFISIEKSDSTGARMETSEIYRWLTEDEKELLPYVNIDEIWNIPTNSNKNFHPGEFYRIKVATGDGDSWHEKVQLVKIDTCTSWANFSLNGNFDDSLTVSITLGEELLIDATSSKFCFDSFMVSVRDISNPMTGVSRRFSRAYSWIENSTTIGNSAQYKYYFGEFNLVDELFGLSDILECGHTYIVNFSIIDYSGSVISMDNKRFRIDTCIANSDFLLYGQYCQEYNSDSIQVYNENTSVFIWSPDFNSCNYEAIIILDDGTNEFDTSITSQDDLIDLRLSGDKNLSTIISKLFTPSNPTPLENQTYTVSLVSINTCTSINDTTTKILTFNGSNNCGTPFNKLIPYSKLKKTEISVFPNPVLDNFIMVQANTNLISKICKIEIFDLSGRLIFNSSNGEKVTNELLKFQLKENIVNGMYLLKVNFEDETYLSKLIIQ